MFIYWITVLMLATVAVLFAVASASLVVAASQLLSRTLDLFIMPPEAHFRSSATPRC